MDISRRFGHRHTRVSQRAFAAVLVTTVALAACTSTNSPSSSGGDTSGLTATTPAATGNLDKITWNLAAGEPASLDYSYTWDTSSGNMVLANLCDNLMRQNPDGTLSPALAESVQTPDPKTYVFTLRQGVTFTDGQPMTAQDVAFSLNRQLDPAIFSYWSVWFQNVASIEATSATEVTVKMKKPDVIFGEMMATPAGAVVQKAYVEAKGKKYGTPSGGVMCTGPYSLQSWNPGKDIVLQANPTYWDSTLQPKVQTIDFTFVRDASTITNGLLSGSIDGTWDTPLSGYEQLKNASSGTLYQNASTRIGYMSMASFDGALKEVQIRQALQKSIDYKGIVTALLKGTATPTAAGAPPASWGYAKDVFSAGYQALPAATQDLEVAKSLVQQAGTPSQPVVIAYDAADSTAAAVVASIQDTASQVGLTVKLKPLPTTTYQSLFFDPNARKGIDAFFVTSTLDIPDPAELYLQLVPSSPYNYTGFSNPAFTNPIMKAQGEADPATRAELVVQGQASAAEIVQMLLTVYSPNQMVFLNERVTGVPVSTLCALYYPWAATLGAP